MKEVWKKVEGYSKYDVSNLGHVRRLMSYNRYRALKCYNTPKGYTMVKLTEKGISRTMSLSRVVAVAFVKNDCDGWIVRHKNGILSDNKANNLYWVDPVRRRFR